MRKNLGCGWVEDLRGVGGDTGLEVGWGSHRKEKKCMVQGHGTEKIRRILIFAEEGERKLGHCCEKK